MSLQILVSFSQLSSRYASLFKHRKQSGTKNDNVRAKEGSFAALDSAICRESLEECFRNFDKDVLTEMRSIDLRRLVTLTAASRHPLQRLNALSSVQRVSYVSSESFEKNKNGWELPTITVDVLKKNARLVMYKYVIRLPRLHVRSVGHNTFITMYKIIPASQVV